MTVAKATTAIAAASPPDTPAIATYSPIGRVTQLADGSLVLHDIVLTSETPDLHGESVDYDSFKAAAPEFMKWATVGEMHDPARHDAGTVLQMRLDDDLREARGDLHVVDPVAVKKVLAKVYKAVSIHGEWKQRIPAVVAGQRVKRLILNFVDEISLVPRGANPDATFAKRFVVAKRELTGAEENDLPDSAFAYIEPGGKKDASGKTVPRSKRHFNISDAAHVRNALARLSTSPFEAKARPKVEAAARRMGIGEPAADKESKVSKAVVAAPAADEVQVPATKPVKPTKAQRKLAKQAKRETKANDPKIVAKVQARAERDVAKALGLVEKARKKAAKHSPPPPPPNDQAGPAEPDGDEPDGDEVAKAVALRALGREKRYRRQLAKTRRVAKSATRRVRKMRRSSGFGRLTRQLAKIGARNNASDLAKIEQIHNLTVGLGYAKCMSKSDGQVTDTPVPARATLAADPQPSVVVSKGDATPIDFEAVLREAIPQIRTESVKAIEASLGRQVADLAQEVAKIGSAGAGGGPLAGVGYFDPATRQFVPTSGASGPVAKSEALTAAANALPDDDPLRRELGAAAAREELLATTPWRRP